MSLNQSLHDLSAVVFIILLALPFVAMGMKSKPKDKLSGSLKLWKVLAMVGNIGLVVSIVTGILRSSGLYGTGWFWAAIVLLIAMGAVLGIASKSIRLSLEAVNKGESYNDSLQKLVSSSWLFFILTIIMIALMIYGPRF